MTPVQTAMVFEPPKPEALARRRQRLTERDRTLEALQHGRRRELIALAHRVAVEMAAANACAMPDDGIPDGCITSSQVKDEMKRRGYLRQDDKATRFLGGCFPGGPPGAEKWLNVGMTTATASKGRPSAVWRLREGSE
jgi:hypothetical protein